MTGGSHNYLHRDVENIAERIEDMAKDVTLTKDVPNAIATDLFKIAAGLEERQEGLSVLEKMYSGDVSADTAVEWWDEYLRLGGASTPRRGDTGESLLDGLHGQECSGTEYSTCRPIAREDAIRVVYMEWCGECGAADWEVIE